MDSYSNQLRGRCYMFKIQIIKYQNNIFYPVQDILQLPYYELIKVEAMVKIYINDTLFFTDDYFPILEFVYQFEQWQNNQTPTIFKYNSIESIENPILSFQVQSENCICDSIWKLTPTPLTVKTSEVINEINTCKKILLTIINTKD